MNELYKKRATNNASKSIRKKCDVAAMAMLNVQASVVCQFANVAAYLAIARSPTLVPATRDMNQSLISQMCKKIQPIFFPLKFMKFIDRSLITDRQSF